jgi:glutamyl/glutaminyl-tRNA synthetase
VTAPAAATRFAPAPTGRLHLGHLVNALYVWGLGRAAARRVILRIEDHDRQRCRPEYEAWLLDDLDRLGLAPDEPSTDKLRAGPSPFRQSDSGPVYEAAVDRLAGVTEVYACDCSRATFAAWRDAHGEPWSGAGCPGSCRSRRLEPRPDIGLRAALGEGDERWHDRLVGPRSGPVAPDGDLLVRDRNGNWTYALCVVVDDLRHGVDLAIRGEDLLEATPAQIRLGAMLGRESAPAFAHHPVIRREDGTKLSKADHATAVGDRLAAGSSPAELFGEALFRAGLTPVERPLAFEEALRLIAPRAQ